MPINRANYPGIPDDFPIEVPGFSLSGAQPKLNLVEEQGKYYQAGTSPREVQDAYAGCDDLARQVLAYCTQALRQPNSSLKVLLLQEIQTLVQIYGVPASQAHWIAARVRALMAMQQVASAGLETQVKEPKP